MQIALSIIRPRWLASLMYGCYALAGGAILVFNDPGISRLMGETGSMIWNLFLVVGGIISIIGSAIVRKYRIELIGLPLLISALVVYGSYIAFRLLDTSSSPGVLIFLSGVMFGSAAGAVGRSVEVLRLTRVLEDVSRRMKSNDNDS